MQYIIARQYLQNEPTRIPLLIPLRGYYDAPTTDELIARFFSRECGVLIRVHTFYDLLKAGRFLVLLDGFDEMGASTSVEARKLNYLKLSPLIADGSKTIITCRPAYFPTGRELVVVFSDYKAQVGMSTPLSASDHPTARRSRRLSSRLDPLQSDTRLAALFKHTQSILLESTEFHALGSLRFPKLHGQS